MQYSGFQSEYPSSDEASLGDDSFANPADDPDDELTWKSFFSWYTRRQEKLSQIEREYVSFIEDEREREGRLFRRWYNMVLQSTQTQPDNRSRSKSTVRKSIETVSAVVSAVSIKAFVDYFARDVICEKYKATEFLDSLQALTEAVVYRFALYLTDPICINVRCCIQENQ